MVLVGYINLENSQILHFWCDIARIPNTNPNPTYTINPEPTSGHCCAHLLISKFRNSSKLCSVNQYDLQKL